MEFNQTILLGIYIHYEELQVRNKRDKKRAKVTLTMSKKMVFRMNMKNHRGSQPKYPVKGQYTLLTE